jgi:hypothetical protein
MTIIPDIYDKIAIVLRELRKRRGSRVVVTAAEVFELYKANYPEDIEFMARRRKRKPASHSLQGYLNGMLNGYSKKIESDCISGPTITYLKKMTYRLP